MAPFHSVRGRVRASLPHAITAAALYIAIAAALLAGAGPLSAAEASQPADQTATVLTGPLGDTGQPVFEATEAAPSTDQAGQTGGDPGDADAPQPGSAPDQSGTAQPVGLPTSVLPEVDIT